MAKNRDNKGKMKNGKKGQQETFTSLVDKADNSTSNKADNKNKSNTAR